MKNAKTIVLSIIILTTIWSCQQSEDSRAAYAAATEASTTKASDQAAPSTNLQDRQYIKSADIAATVPSVSTATEASERWVQSAQGVVLESHTTRQVVDTRQESHSGDSLLVKERISIQCDMLVRIPTIYLDSFLTFIKGTAIMVERRDITLRDASISLMEQSLRESNTIDNRSIDRASAVSSGADDILSVADARARAVAQGIDLKVSGATLQDQLQYADIKVQLSQHDIVTTSVVPDIPSMIAPDYSYEIQQSLLRGVSIIRFGTLAFITLWPLWIVASVIIYFLWRRRKARQVLAG